jgi:hypothetical protein
VDRGRGRGDVLEHARVEARSLDEHLGRCGAALGESKRELPAVDGTGDETLGVVADPVVGNG